MLQKYNRITSYYYLNISQAKGHVYMLGIFLKILLTMGLSGFLCWMIGWGGLVYQYIKNSFSDTGQILYFLPMMAYIGQSLVNSATINFALWQ